MLRPSLGFPIIHYPAGDVQEADTGNRHFLEVEKENAELKRANMILQEANGVFAVRRKK